MSTSAHAVIASLAVNIDINIEEHLAPFCMHLETAADRYTTLKQLHLHLHDGTLANLNLHNSDSSRLQTSSISPNHLRQARLPFQSHYLGQWLSATGQLG